MTQVIPSNKYVNIHFFVGVSKVELDIQVGIAICSQQIYRTNTHRWFVNMHCGYSGISEE